MTGWVRAFICGIVFLTILAAPAYAQAANGPFDSGVTFVVLGVVAIIIGAFAAYAVHFKLSVSRTNEHGVEIYRNSGDYLKNVALNMLAGVLLVAWFIGAFILIFVGISI